MVAASPIRAGGCASRHSRNCQVYYRTVSIRLPQEDYNSVKSIRGASWIQGSDSQLWKRCAASVPNSRRENLNTGWPKPMSGHGIKSPPIHPSRHPTRLVYGPSEQHQKFISRPNRPKHARVCSCGFRVAEAPNAICSIRVGGTALNAATVKRGSHVSRHVNFPKIAVAVAATSLYGRHGCSLTGYTYLSVEVTGRLN